jgi:hypothetical protein
MIDLNEILEKDRDLSMEREDDENEKVAQSC